MLRSMGTTEFRCAGCDAVLKYKVFHIGSKEREEVDCPVCGHSLINERIREMYQFVSGITKDGTKITR